MPILLFLFILVPVVEMYILIKVGGVIGGFYTIALVLITAMIGVSLLKKQGLSTFITAQQKMQTGAMPLKEIAEGFMLAIAGALLLTPGFVTDTVGFVLLTPILRQRIANAAFEAWMKRANHSQDASQTYYYSQSESFRRGGFGASHQDDIIEGEFREVSEEKIEKK